MSNECVPGDLYCTPVKESMSQNFWTLMPIRKDSETATVLCWWYGLLRLPHLELSIGSIYLL